MKRFFSLARNKPPVNTFMHTYKYPRPCVTADAVVVTRSLPHKILLILRGKDPFKGHWALPGGHVDESEDLEVAARRELYEETNLNLSNSPFTQIGAYGKPGRDPKGHVITVAYVVSVDVVKAIKAGDDAVKAQWFDIDDLPKLAFDHAEIVKDGISRIMTD